MVDPCHDLAYGYMFLIISLWILCAAGKSSCSSFYGVLCILRSHSSKGFCLIYSEVILVTIKVNDARNDTLFTGIFPEHCMFLQDPLLLNLITHGSLRISMK